MKRFRLVLFVLAAILWTNSIGAEENLIPRRIRIIDPNGTTPPLIAAVLYSRLTQRVPLVVSRPDEEPHNLIILEYGDQLTITLQDRSETLDQRQYPADLNDDPIAASAAFDTLAVDWESFLGLVKPDVSEELEIRREEMAEEVSFEERLITPYQATLWLPISARQIIVTDGDSENSRWIWNWPLRFDFAWFFKENLGLTTSFRFEYGNHLSFGTDSSDNRNALSTTNLMLMPGVGLQIRTVGKISAEFGISMFFGIVRVKADENLYKPNIAEGESAWIFYPVLSLEPAIVWSPSVHWSVKFRILEFNMNLAGLAGSENASYGTGENTILLNYLQLGASYRW